MGMMISLNQSIDFENAEIVTLDYNKTIYGMEEYFV